MNVFERSTYSFRFENECRPAMIERERDEYSSFDEPIELSYF